MNELVVPMHTPIKVILSSTDVLHSFYIPVMRVKMDVLPNIMLCGLMQINQENIQFLPEYWN